MSTPALHPGEVPSPSLTFPVARFNWIRANQERGRRGGGAREREREKQTKSTVEQKRCKEWTSNVSTPSLLCCEQLLRGRVSSGERARRGRPSDLHPAQGC
ncbi:hypothetical protein GJAV_G00225190 [Gymnothorax javanicus]|nr:hypothetical protein GJAV_G00225190 [Gymnothorax javanicus]